jgi:Fic family protein
MHYTFASIHPYEVSATALHRRALTSPQDGNGRMARLLACVPFILRQEVPLVVLADKKMEYLAALRTVGPFAR